MIRKLARRLRMRGLAGDTGSPAARTGGTAANPLPAAPAPAAPPAPLSSARDKSWMELLTARLNLLSAAIGAFVTLTGAALYLMTPAGRDLVRGLPGPDPTVTIAHPRDGTVTLDYSVPKSAAGLYRDGFSGIQRNTPADKYLWLVTQPLEEGATFHPHGRPCYPPDEDGQFDCPEFFLGQGPASAGKRFRVIATLVDDAAASRFDRYNATAARIGQYPGLPELPESATEMDRVTLQIGS